MWTALKKKLRGEGPGVCGEEGKAEMGGRMTNG